MANPDQTPHLTELKAISGFEQLHKAFKFLYEHQYADDEGFIQLLGEKRDELQVTIEKTTARLAELWDLDHDEEDCAGDVHECEHKLLVSLRRRLEAITALLFELRQGMKEKEVNISVLDVYG